MPFFQPLLRIDWHANDAGFLIFLRKHGLLLIFFGVCVVIYGLFRTACLRSCGDSERGLDWVVEEGDRNVGKDDGSACPIGSASSRSLSRRLSKRRSTQDDEQSVPLNDVGRHDSIGSTSAANQVDKGSMAAPHLTRLSLCRSSAARSRTYARDSAPQSVLAWMVRHFPPFFPWRCDQRNGSQCTGDSPSKKKGFSTFLPTLFVEMMAAAPHPTIVAFQQCFFAATHPICPPRPITAFFQLVRPQLSR